MDLFLRAIIYREGSAVRGRFAVVRPGIDLVTGRGGG